jgi:hypothetical protein
MDSRRPLLVEGRFDLAGPLDAFHVIHQIGLSILQGGGRQQGPTPPSATTAAACWKAGQIEYGHNVFRSVVEGKEATPALWPCEIHRGSELVRRATPRRCRENRQQYARFCLRILQSLPTATADELIKYHKSDKKKWELAYTAAAEANDPSKAAFLKECQRTRFDVEALLVDVLEHPDCLNPNWSAVSLPNAEPYIPTASGIPSRGKVIFRHHGAAPMQHGRVFTCSASSGPEFHQSVRQSAGRCSGSPSSAATPRNFTWSK